MPKRVVTWPMPHTEMKSDQFTIEVEGTPVPVWLARVREKINMPDDCGWTSMFNGPTDWASFARFDADYPVTVSVAVGRAFDTAEVLPHSAGITPEIDGGTIRFQMDRPRHLTVCFDGGDEHPLHLFCREVETDVPDPSDDSVVYFGPGEHWVESIKVESGQTVYIDGGAILRAALPAGIKGTRGGVLNLFSYGQPVINIDGVKNVRICGRGIIDGGCLPHPARNLMRVSNSENVRIEGVTLRNSPGWHLPIWASDNVVVDDLSCISGRLNSDGVNCVSSTNVRVSRTFVRGHDDSFVVKTTMPERPSANILYEDCVAWNDWGYAFGVSYETRANISDVTFRNCDVIFSRNWALGIHVSDGGSIGPVTFEKMGIHYHRTSIIPHMSRESIRLDIRADVWGKDSERGQVENIVFRDVAFTGEEIPPLVIEGNDPDHQIRNVLFKNVTINKQPLSESNIQMNEHVGNIQVE